MSRRDPNESSESSAPPPRPSGATPSTPPAAASPGGAPPRPSPRPSSHPSSRPSSRSSPRDAAGALAALAEGAALLAPRPELGALRLTGPDRHDFLHGQISADVRGLPRDGFREALLLNHRGHALAQLGVCRREDDLFVAVEAGQAATVAASLRAHIVFDQVTLEPLEGQLASVLLQGEPAALQPLLAALQLEVPAAGRFVQAPFGSARLLAHPLRRTAVGGVALHALARDVEALTEALLDAGAVGVTPDALAALRVAAGIPLAPLDAGEGVLPQEAGLEPLVSYRKGCYLGQEIMARIEARGSLKRALAGVRLAAPPAGSPPHELRAGERTVGRLGSWAHHPRLGWIALAVLRRELPPEAELQVVGGAADPDGQGVRVAAEAVVVPFAQIPAGPPPADA